MLDQRRRRWDNNKITLRQCLVLAGKGVLQRQHVTPDIDCYRLGVVSYSSDPSGDLVGPLVDVPEAKLGHYNHVAGHATPQRPSMTA